MRHRVAGRSLGRPTGQRQALLRNLVTELFRHGRIRTTEARAKAIRAKAERLVSVAKRGRQEGGNPIHARRRLSAVLCDAAVAKQVFDSLPDRFASRPGGYTRILRLGPRKGDGAPMVLIELVE